MPDFLFGATKNLAVEKFDVEGAKKLLAEAGYPDGFGLTIHTPNNRYVNDEQIAQAVAQMLSRGGVPTKVVAMPSATYFTQATDLKFSFMLLGWSTGTGEASSSLKALLMTFNRDKGFGTANRGRYTEHESRRADRGRAADRRRHQARGVPAARHRDRDQRYRHHPAALPGQPVGGARRHRLPAAARRADARAQDAAEGQQQHVVQRNARNAQIASQRATTRRPGGGALVTRVLEPAPADADTFRRVAALAVEVRQALEGSKRALETEVRLYPTPIPRCDEQFNHLYEQRSRVTALLGRLGRALDEGDAGELVSACAQFARLPAADPEGTGRRLRERVEAALAVAVVKPRR